MPNKTHYEILKIPQDAKSEEIRNAYRKQVLLHHPDKDPTNKEAGAEFRQIHEAYEILSDTNRRTIYDGTLEPEVKAHATPMPSSPKATRNQFFTSVGSLKRIVHFTSMNIVDGKPNGVQISIPITEKMPEGFFFKESGETYLGFKCVPERERSQYYSYTSREITDWTMLEKLFDTLKASQYQVIYTFKGDTKEVTHFDQFKEAILSEHEHKGLYRNRMHGRA